jgi:hypothetical protein
VERVYLVAFMSVSFRKNGWSDVVPFGPAQIHLNARFRVPAKEKLFTSSPPKSDRGVGRCEAVFAG